MGEAGLHNGEVTVTINPRDPEEAVRWDRLFAFPGSPGVDFRAWNQVATRWAFPPTGNYALFARSGQGSSQ